MYGDAIFYNNFKSLFKSIISNQQNLNQVGIDKFLRALSSLGIKKMILPASRLKSNIVM